MKKKWLIGLLAVVLAAGIGAGAAVLALNGSGGASGVSAPGTAVEKNADAVIDYSNARDGYVMIKWTGESGV